MDQKEALIEAQMRIRNAKNELVIAVLALDFTENFSDTIASLKETIGDLKVSENLAPTFMVVGDVIKKEKL